MGKRGHVLGGGGYQHQGAQHFVLSMIDLDSWLASGPDAPAKAEEDGREVVTIPLGFLPHGLVIDPTCPQHAAVFEKKGPGACIVDLKERAILERIPTAESRRFYGHGAYSQDGSLLYATESILDRNLEGVLVVRDARTLAELGTVPTYGAAPHDCQLLADGRTMVIANGGGDYPSLLQQQAGVDAAPGCVSYVDLASEKLLDRVCLDSPRHNAGHLVVTSSGDVALVSAPRAGLPGQNEQLGAVSLRPPHGKLTTLREPRAVVERMLGETLSVVVNEKERVVLATHPLGNCVSCWTLDGGAFLGTLELSGPRGIAMTLDKEWYLVSHVAGKSVRISAFSEQTRAPVGFYIDPSFTSGSHLFVHDLQ